MLEDRPDVVAFLQHAAGINFPFADPPQAIGTYTMVLANNGRKAATNVRLGHAVLPTLPTIQRPAWMRRALWSLAGIGLVTTLYLLARAMMDLYARA